jgi:hypothetical protein
MPAARACSASFARPRRRLAPQDLQQFHDLNRLARARHHQNRAPRRSGDVVQQLPASIATAGIMCAFGVFSPMEAHIDPPIAVITTLRLDLGSRRFFTAARRPGALMPQHPGSNNAALEYPQESQDHCATNNIPLPRCLPKPSARDSTLLPNPFITLALSTLPPQTPVYPHTEPRA